LIKFISKFGRSVCFIVSLPNVFIGNPMIKETDSCLKLVETTKYKIIKGYLQQLSSASRI